MHREQIREGLITVLHLIRFLGIVRVESRARVHGNISFLTVDMEKVKGIGLGCCDQ